MASARITNSSATRKNNLICMATELPSFDVTGAQNGRVSHVQRRARPASKVADIGVWGDDISSHAPMFCG